MNINNNDLVANNTYSTGSSTNNEQPEQTPTVTLVAPSEGAHNRTPSAGMQCNNSAGDVHLLGFDIYDESESELKRTIQPFPKSDALAALQHYLDNAPSGSIFKVFAFSCNPQNGLLAPTSGISLVCDTNTITDPNPCDLSTLPCADNQKNPLTCNCCQNGLIWCERLQRCATQEECYPCDLTALPCADEQKNPLTCRCCQNGYIWCPRLQRCATPEECNPCDLAALPCTDEQKNPVDCNCCGNGLIWCEALQRCATPEECNPCDLAALPCADEQKNPVDCNCCGNGLIWCESLQRCATPEECNPCDLAALPCADEQKNPVDCNCCGNGMVWCEDLQRCATVQECQDCEESEVQLQWVTVPGTAGTQSPTLSPTATFAPIGIDAATGFAKYKFDFQLNDQNGIYTGSGKVSVSLSAADPYTQVLTPNDGQFSLQHGAQLPVVAPIFRIKYVSDDGQYSLTWQATFDTTQSLLVPSSSAYQIQLLGNSAPSTGGTPSQTQLHIVGGNYTFIANNPNLSNCNVVAPESVSNPIAVVSSSYVSPTILNVSHAGCGTIECEINVECGSTTIAVPTPAYTIDPNTCEQCDNRSNPDDCQGECIPSTETIPLIRETFKAGTGKYLIMPDTSLFDANTLWNLSGIIWGAYPNPEGQNQLTITNDVPANFLYTVVSDAGLGGCVSFAAQAGCKDYTGNECWDQCDMEGILEVQRRCIANINYTIDNELYNFGEEAYINGIDHKFSGQKATNPQDIAAFLNALGTGTFVAMPPNTIPETTGQEVNYNIITEDNYNIIAGDKITVIPSSGNILEFPFECHLVLNAKLMNANLTPTNYTWTFGAGVTVIAGGGPGDDSVAVSGDGIVSVEIAVAECARNLVVEFRVQSCNAAAGNTGGFIYACI